MKPVPQLFEFAAELEMIVDFPVEDYRGVAVIGDDGLVAALQVDDFQAGRTHGKNAGTEHSALIGAAMSQRSSGAFDPLRFGRPVFMCEPGYPAQIRAPFARRLNQPAFQTLLSPLLVS